MSTAPGAGNGPSGSALPAPPIDVLIVDDVEDIRHLLRLVLGTDARFRVVGEARDGVEAIERAGALAPDLIVLDLAMPRLDGFAALPRIHEVAPHARVVILTAFGDADVEGRVLSLGAVGYLDKRLRPADLVEGLAALAGALEVVEQAVAEARSRLAAEVQSAGSARRFVETTLEEWDCADSLEIVKLLVSELVTNAVLHAGSDAEVVVQLTPSVLHIEVLDDSPVMPVMRQPGSSDTSGRGLALVANFASAWGTRRLAHGKSVWFDVPRSMASDGHR
ncbi:MAG TPA: response regulator [Acidimicrobiales bacterium]|nr:response regulator [Acidimicrobiales bacterium]